MQRHADTNKVPSKRRDPFKVDLRRTVDPICGIFPALLFTMIQIAAAQERDGAIPAVRAVSITAGLLLIPVLYYTYTGILGRHVLWADIAIFYLAAALTFRLDSCLRRRRRLWGPWPQAAGLLWLWGLAFLFVWWTFRPPHIGLFLDPATGGYGIA